MNSEVKYLVEHGFAVPWSSPSVLVPKPDKTFRFCNDYRKVNAAKSDSFPLPPMEDCINQVSSSKFMTKLDLLRGYWQVPLTPQASEVSAFVAPDHLLQYTVMPFVLQCPGYGWRNLNSLTRGVGSKDEFYSLEHKNWRGRAAPNKNKPCYRTQQQSLMKFRM